MFPELKLHPTSIIHRPPNSFHFNPENGDNVFARKAGIQPEQSVQGAVFQKTVVGEKSD
jgi:hypothetical protein